MTVGTILFVLIGLAVMIGVGAAVAGSSGGRRRGGYDAGYHQTTWTGASAGGTVSGGADCGPGSGGGDSGGGFSGGDGGSSC